LAFLLFTSFEKPRLHERTKAIRGCSMNSAIECALKPRTIIITSSLLQNLYTYIYALYHASVIMYVVVQNNAMEVCNNKINKKCIVCFNVRINKRKVCHNNDIYYGTII
jgi:hypothetical protein